MENTETLFESIYNDLSNDTFYIEKYITEGATWDSIKIVMGTDTKKIKNDYKEANRLFANGDKKGALIKITECKKGFEKLKQELTSVNETTASKVCGFLIGSGILQLFINVKAAGSKGAVEWGGGYLLKLITFQVGAVLGAAIKLVFNINKLKKSGDNTDISYFRSDILVAINENIKLCDALINKIKNS